MAGNDFNFELGLVADFIAQRFGDFLGFLEEYGIDEPQAEEIVNELERRAGRN